MKATEDTDEVLRAVSSAVLAVTRHLSAAEVLEMIVRSARELADARYGALGIPDDNEGFAEFIADGITDRQREAIGPLPRQHGMLAALLHGGETIRSRDIRADSRFGYFPKAHPVMTDFLGVPIRDAGEVVGIIFLSGKAGGFTARDERLLTLFASHAAIAIANARLYERSRELTVLHERTRLARELHDAVTQKLFSLRLEARAAATLSQRDPLRAQERLRRVEDLAAEATAELRSIIVELRPAELDSDGLSETLRKHLVMVERMHAIHTRFETSGPVRLATEREVEVLRIVQEAVHNTVRHARAGQVSVRLSPGPGVRVEVTDDGVGFDAEAQPGRGMGLTSMRERARQAGGELEVDSVPGEGTTIRLVIPE